MPAFEQRVTLLPSPPPAHSALTSFYTIVMLRLLRLFFIHRLGNKQTSVLHASYRRAVNLLGGSGIWSLSSRVCILILFCGNHAPCLAAVSIGKMDGLCSASPPRRARKDGQRAILSV